MTTATRATLRVAWHVPGSRPELGERVAAILASVSGIDVELWRFDGRSGGQAAQNGTADASGGVVRARQLDPRRLDNPAVLPGCDVAVLDRDSAADWQRRLGRLAAPPLLIGNEPSPLGLVVSDEDADAVAGCVWLLACDPPTRRRSLDALYQADSASEDDCPARWRIEGVFDSSYSLAAVNRQLALALGDQLPADRVALMSFEQGEDHVFDFTTIPGGELLEPQWQRGRAALPVPLVALRNAWPPAVWGMQGRYRVLANYHWEETGFPAAFAEQFNRTLDLITVGSHQTRRFLADAGVRVPVAVVGDGVDHLAASRAGALPVDLPAGFRFLHVSSCFPRKGLDVLLEAFGEVFRASDPVCLVVKTFPNPHNTAREQLRACRAADPDFPRVELIEDDWTPEQIAALYRHCHALVAPGRGEGFGLPIAEAMRLRLPVVTSRWGGQMDFCDEQGVWLVDGQLAQAETHLSSPGSLWFEPDPRSLARALRAVHAADEARLERKLRHAADRIAPFSWERVAARTRQALDHVRGQPGPLPKTRIGWVSTWQARCGVAMYSHYMAAGMTGEALTVFAPQDAERVGADEGNVRRCWERGAAFRVESLLAAIRRAGLEAAVIQCHWAFFPPAALTALITALDEEGLHVYLDVHNTRGAPEELRHSRAFRAALARCRRVFVHTLDDVAAAQSWGLLDNLTLFPLAAYPVPRPEPSAIAARRAELGLTDGKVIASYGFLMPHKGLMELLEAVALLCRDDPAVHLLMVNAHYSEEVSGPEAARLAERIEDLGLGERVTVEPRFLPDEESLLLLRTADLVVFPYQHSQESSSAAVRMALRGGCPVAVTPLTIFADCASGVLRLPGTAPEELAEGIGDALAQLADSGVARDLHARAEALAAAMASESLSARMLGLIQAELRQVPVA